MLKIASLASLLAVIAISSSARADDKCTKGKELVSVHHEAADGQEKRANKDDLFTFTIFEGGAWEVKGTKNASGCLPADDKKAVTDALATKPKWQKIPVDVRCEALAITHSVYFIDGKPVYTRELCGAVTTDAASLKVADAIDHAYANRDGKAAKK